MRRDTGNIYALIYVDDLLVAARSLYDIAEFKMSVGKEFEIRDMGKVTLFLGIQVHRDRKDRTVTLTQEKYTLSILGRFGMVECRPNIVPLRK